VVTIREILRNYKLLGAIKPTARALSCAKGTVKRIVRFAREAGILEGELPSESQLNSAWKARKKRASKPSSALEPLRENIQALLQADIPLVRIQELLAERHGWSGHYETLKRFTRPFREDRKVCVRLEVSPGEEAQVDFGYLGLHEDPQAGRRRKVWLFLMTLSHSRHFYAEMVYTQDLYTWIACHRRAFEFFGGVPKKIILDNLKTAVVKAALYDPLVNRSYLECAGHYGFVLSPCRVATPQHKGKVERSVGYVQKSFWAGRAFLTLSEGNSQLREWVLNHAGLRDHGTTHQQPRVAFEMVEKQALKPLPHQPFSLVAWKEAKVHPDCHVTVEGSYYSVPHRFRGLTLLIRLTDNLVQAFHNHELVASHNRSFRKGSRSTVKDHYPPEKLAFLEHTPQWCLRESSRIGEATHELMRQILLGRHPLDGLRKAQAILRLAKSYLPQRMEAASKRALYYETFTYQSLKNILQQGLDQKPLPEDPRAEEASQTFAFARPIGDFLDASAHKNQLQEETSWK